MTEACFDCLGRKWVGVEGQYADGSRDTSGFTRCRRCNGSGYEPESHPEKAYVTR